MKLRVICASFFEKKINKINEILSPTTSPTRAGLFSATYFKNFFFRISSFSTRVESRDSIWVKSWYLEIGGVVYMGM